MAAKDSLVALRGVYLHALSVRRFSEDYQTQAAQVIGTMTEYLSRQGVRRARAVAETHVTGYLSALGRRKYRGRCLAMTTRYLYAYHIKRFFAFLFRDGFVLCDPAQAVELARCDSLPRSILTVRQAEKLMNSPDPTLPMGIRDRAILETMYGSGLRRRETVRLDIADLSLSERSLFIRNGKGRRDRLVPLSARAALALDRYLTDGRPHFVRDPRVNALFLLAEKSVGQRLTLNSLATIIMRRGRDVGLRLSPHTLRHSCATHLLKGGADIAHVQALLGHRSVSTTAIYTRVDVSDLSRALQKSHPCERRDARAARRGRTLRSV